VPSAALAAIAYGADGVIIESHLDPQRGIGDDPKQSIKPPVLKQLITDIEAVWAIKNRKLSTEN
jgi:3-deoxy-7-phosphoheptulonate synthase